MKQITALALVLALLLGAAPALAEGRLVIDQQCLRIYKPYVFLFAKISNAGDAPIEISSQLELRDIEGEVFRSGEFSVLGSVLHPGEYTYAYYGVYLYGDTEVDGYVSEMEGVEDSGFLKTTRYPAKAELDMEEEQCIFISFTNTADQTVFGLSVSGILLDEEGGVLYLSVPVLYDLGVTPGSTVIFKCELPPYVLKNIEGKTLTVDSAVYTEDFE